MTTNESLTNNKMVDWVDKHAARMAAGPDAKVLSHRWLFPTAPDGGTADIVYEAKVEQDGGSESTYVFILTDTARPLEDIISAARESERAVPGAIPVVVVPDVGGHQIQHVRFELRALGIGQMNYPTGEYYPAKGA